MNVWEEISSIVKRNLDVFYEIEAKDTGMRFKLNDDERRQKAPWIMMGREKLAIEELGVWRKLDRGDLSKPDAISELQSLMATYYGES